jgi:hypothetical protein
MLLIRDIFRCKPGKARQVAEMLKGLLPSFEQHDGFRNSRVLVDLVAEYWTVVLEAEVEDLAQFERHMQTYGSRPEVREAMAGYTELVEGGRREIFRIL